MFKKTGLTALALAAVMLLSVFAFAEGGSEKYYLRLEDPYFTDGETEYDLSGMKVELQLSQSTTFEQLLLSVITAKGTARAAIEAAPESVSIYGDGFSASYTMTPEYMFQILSEYLGNEIDFEGIADDTFDDDTVILDAEMPSLSLKDAIDDIYLFALTNVWEMMENAPTETVDTFAYTGLEAKVVDFEITPSQIEEWILPMLQELDVVLKTSENFASEQVGEIMPATGSYAELYETNIKPLNISLKGRSYVGSDNIYIVCDIYMLDQLITTAYAEVINGDASALYLNMPIVDVEGKTTTLYITAEVNKNGDDGERFELGATDGETPMLLMLIDHKGIDYDVYFGVAKDTDFFELSAKYSCDEKTKRNLWLSGNINGIMIEMDYAGVITTAADSQNERANLSVTTNMGIAAKAVIEFGTAPFDAKSIIPSTDTVPVVNLDGITPEQNAQLSVDFNNLLTQTIIILQYGVPGFSALLSQISQSVG